MMKKAVAALVLVLCLGAVSFGEEAKDSGVYLRQDVFEAKMDAFMKEIRGELQVMNAKIDALSRRVDDNYRSLDTRISDLSNILYLFMVLLGVVISLPIVQKILQGREERKEADTKTEIIEEVKRLIAENNAELLRTLRA